MIIKVAKLKRFPPAKTGQNLNIRKYKPQWVYYSSYVSASSSIQILK